MAPGPPPKPTRRRVNKNPLDDVIVTVRPKPKRKPPRLPGGFSAATRRWYQTWLDSPQAEAFQDTDWQRLQMVAPLVEQYFGEPKQQLMAEIRLNESLLGATTVDRLRGRIKIAEPEAAKLDEGVVKLDDYRDIFGA